MLEGGFSIQASLGTKTRSTDLGIQTETIDVSTPFYTFHQPALLPLPIPSRGTPFTRSIVPPCCLHTCGHKWKGRRRCVGRAERAKRGKVKSLCAGKECQGGIECQSSCVVISRLDVDHSPDNGLQHPSLAGA